jgi:hypothetical protein
MVTGTVFIKGADFIPILHCLVCSGLHNSSQEVGGQMHISDYYREEASKYRLLAEATNDAVTMKEFLELAEACEAVADEIDDCRASG